MSISVKRNIQIKDCPIAARNKSRRRNRLVHRQNSTGSTSSACSDSSSDKRGTAEQQERPSKNSKKKKKPRQEESVLPFDPNLKGDTQDEFCTLCEVERLLARAHSRPEVGSVDYNTNAGPVVPETFTSGFMTHVAPWFRRGVQEDSHEFLRLLIDAMQNSCKSARSTKGGETDGCSTSNKSISSPTRKVSRSSSKEDQDDTEYPFRLFRGTVESNVTCSACRAVSRKIDPIEDIGLDILPVKKAPQAPSARGSAYRGSNSRSTSPNNVHTPLASIPEALERFTSIEHLDSGYKCEKCGKTGKATKTSQLASIPPILTLHLKRFRYGSMSSGPRSARAEVGPSGSAKIEGHVGFSHILNIKPYLTDELTKTTFKTGICRLFAVVVHNGKNSHSGHYVAYVLSLKNNKQWWKMDDANVVQVDAREVLACEAYMLFYRVVDHPVSKSLSEIANKRIAEEKKIREEMERVIREAQMRAKEEEDRTKATTSIKVAVPDAKIEVDEVSLGKRKRPEFASGEEWAKKMTSLPPSYYPLLQQIQDYISENVTFQPQFFEYITEEYNRNSCGDKKIKSLLGKGPSGVYPPDDVQDQAQDIRGGILDLFHMLSILYKKDNPNGFLLPKPEDEKIEVLPAVTVDQELIIPQPEGFDGYDGAL